ncbi:MAG: glycoside hydrolase family 78 protein [Anaerolineae bacterium]|nr:glycoside hydrolase family 78 protein [Anaerolineae bacterium]
MAWLHLDKESAVKITNLRCEYKENPIGIDVTQPRLSWQIAAHKRGTLQSAYQIQVAESDAALSNEDLLWDSGKVASGASIHHPYEGPPLRSGQHCAWRVRAWDGDDVPSQWSGPAYWEMGLLSPSDWQASWIQPDIEEDLSTSQPCPMLRATFSVDGAVRSARAYVTALGLYEMMLNHERVSEDVLAPGWTSYQERLHYQTYDVTDLLVEGENAVGAVLGDGWYRGNLGFQGQRNLYGEKLALLLQLQIVYEDGRVQTVCSDERWKAATGPILGSDIYNGEHYDARLEKPGWSEAGYDDGDWAGVQVVEHDKEILVAPPGPPVRRFQEVKAVEILHTPAGETVVDMGQNMVGWVRLKVEGKAGTTVTLRHAEVLDQKGNLYTENLRLAQQTVSYTLKGDGIEVYEPRFTFQGFRFVAVDGYPGELTLDSLTGVVVHSDMRRTGQFECSAPLINQLQHNIVWGQKGNYVDVPTDCPQRDERLGWTGDAQVFVRTGCFNMDVAGFFTKWLKDLAADQAENGAVGHVIPNVMRRRRGQAGGSAAWGDASTICPWTIYLCYGDMRILAEQYDSMRAWVEYIAAEAGEDRLWSSGFHFGDWLAYATTRSDYPGATTDKDLIATAFFAYSTALVGQTAQVLGKTQDAAHYAALLAEIVEAFRREFVTETGRMASNTQTAYTLALWFDLLPEALRPEAARRLAEDVKSFQNHLTTGFVGTPYLCHTLSSNGYLDVAYDLLNQESYPSWLYPVTQGATTIWERWDGIKPDGSFQDAGMNSFNHYAYGAIGSWLYQVVAGLEIDPQAPGYKHALIQPQPGGGLSSAAATLETIYGPLGSAWELDEDEFSLQVTVPANTWATVRLPDASLAQVTESGQPLTGGEGVMRTAQEGDAVLVEIGSGDYRFAYPAANLFAQLQAARRLSSHSPLTKLRDNEAAWALVVEHLPELAQRSLPWLDRAIERGASLRQMGRFGMSVLTPEGLDALDEALAQL